MKVGQHIGCLILNVSAGKLGKHCQALLDKWTKNCGQEWTVERLKALWNIALHHRNKDPESAKLVCQEKSISYSKSTCIPTGPFGQIISTFATTKRKSVLKRTAAVLRSYTLYRNKRPTHAQIAKGRKTIESLPKTRKNIFLEMQFAAAGYKMRKWIPDLDIMSQGVRAMGHQIKACSYYYYNEDMFQIPQKEKKRPYSYFFMSKYSSTYCPPSLEHCTAEAPFRQDLREYLKENIPEKYVAKVSILQEGGCKPRIVCMPNVWTQLAFCPLHYALEGIVKQLPASCMHDQSKGVELIMEHMSKGGYTSSVDMSAATDRVPLYLQTALLRGAGLSVYASALEDFVQQPMLYDGDKKPIRYNTGQPMGLYGSFPLFHLSNITLCSIAEELTILHWENDLSRFSNGSTFVVLGDDVVFSDPLVGEVYKGLLRTIGVDISVPKSFVGSLAEFAGFITTECGNDIFSFRPYKYPDNHRIVNNPLSLLDSLGGKVKDLGKTAKQKQFWQGIAERFRLTRPLRDLTLAPLTCELRETIGNDFRGDTKQIAARGAALFYMNKVELRSSYFDFIADCQGENIYSTRGHPIFPKRDLTRIYGYREDKLIQKEKEERRIFGSAVTPLSRDPLFSLVVSMSTNLQTGGIEIMDDEDIKVVNTLDPSIRITSLSKVEKRDNQKGFFTKLLSHNPSLSYESLMVQAYVLDETNNRRKVRSIAENRLEQECREISRIISQQPKSTSSSVINYHLLKKGEINVHDWGMFHFPKDELIQMTDQELNKEGSIVSRDSLLSVTHTFDVFDEIERRKSVEGKTQLDYLKGSQDRCPIHKPLTLPRIDTISSFEAKIYDIITRDNLDYTNIIESYKYDPIEVDNSSLSGLISTQINQYLELRSERYRTKDFKIEVQNKIPEWEEIPEYNSPLQKPRDLVKQASISSYLPRKRKDDDLER